MKTVASLLEDKGREVLTVGADQSVYEAIAEMDRKNVGALLVMDGDRIAGIVTERDYLRKVILKNRSSKETPVRTIMSSDLISIDPDTSVKQAMRVMTEHRCRHLPVMDQDRLVGLVSIGDLVKTIIANQELKIQMLEDYVTSR